MIQASRTVVGVVILLQAFTRGSLGKPTVLDNRNQIIDNASELNWRELEEMEKESGANMILQQAKEQEKVTLKDEAREKSKENDAKFEETKKSKEMGIKKNDNEEEVNGSDKNVEQLEKEKGELFKQINAAIDESIILLNASNATDTRVGIDFLLDLKGQLATINGTDLKFFRDKNDHIQRRNAPSKKKISIAFDEIASLFNKDTKVAPFDSREQGKVLMQKKIDEWILQRKLEKKRIQEYKDRVKMDREGGQEKCPRQGEGKKTIKDKGEKRGRYFPCCRKCCKRSYMGCL